MEEISQDRIEGVRSLFDLTGCTALVSGASRGLGRGMALALAAAGAVVAAGAFAAFQAFPTRNGLLILRKLTRVYR